MFDILLFLLIISIIILKAEQKSAETIYYICGWVLCACKSESLWRGITSAAENLMHLVKSCSLNKSFLSTILPTKKATRSEKYGGMIYSVESFFSFIKSVEFMFSNLLTAKAITIYCDELVGKFIDCLNNNSTVYTIVSSFFSWNKRKGMRNGWYIMSFFIKFISKISWQEIRSCIHGKW